jgi:acyl-CoA thioester hydrolase
MNDAHHRTRCRVIYADTDAGGVVYHATYLRYCEIGRSELMRGIGLIYQHIEEQGIILPVTECRLRFKAPARYDDMITVDTHVGSLTGFTCRFNYRIEREQADQPKPTLLVKGFTVHAAITKAGRLIRIPESIYTPLHRLCQATGHRSQTGT